MSFTHMNLRFLQDNQRKDKYGKLHSHPDYDKRTLHVSILEFALMIKFNYFEKKFAGMLV